MSDKNFLLSITLGVVDKATAELQKFNDKIKANQASISAAATIMTGFGATVTASLGMAVKSAAESELVYSRLQKAIESSGMAWAGAKPQVDDFIISLQKTSKFSDEELANALQRTIGFTNDLDQGMRAAKIAVDMAGSGMYNLDAATRMVSMAAEGNIQMLGKFIPELRGTSNALLEGMTSSQKAEYALKLLQDRFGGMAQTELQTTIGKFTSFKNSLDDTAEEIGVVLLPALNSFMEISIKIINGIRNWIKENPNLVSAIVQFSAVIGVLSTGLGGVLFILPQIISGFSSMFAVLQNHPIMLVIAAFVGLQSTLLALGSSYVDAQQKNINMMKTHEDRLKSFQTEKNEIDQLILSRKNEVDNYSVGQKTMTATAINESKFRNFTEEELALRSKALSFNIAQEKIKLEEESSQRLSAIKSERMQKDSIEEESRRAENLKKVQEAAWSESEVERVNSEQMKSYRENMGQSISGSWTLLMSDMHGKSVNFYEKFKEVTNAITASTSGAFQDMMKNVGGGWEVLTKGMQKIAEGIRDAIIKAIADMAAKWVVDHATMSMASNLWKQKEVSANSAVAATKAAAATAWSLWGAIAIGAAIGAGVMALSNQFATGVNNFEGGMALVGERGPELVSLPSGSSVFTNSKSASMLSGGSSINIIVDVHNNEILGDNAIDDLSEKIGRSIMSKVQMEMNV